MKIFGSSIIALSLLAPAWGFQAAPLRKAKISTSTLDASIPPAPGSQSQSPGNTASADWQNMQRMSPFVRVEGESRRTWQFGDITKEVVQVVLKTEGRPMKAVTELWVGPDWTPLTLKFYSEDGSVRPVQTLIGTRSKEANVEIRNAGSYEFPFSGSAAYAEGPLKTAREDVAMNAEGRYVEGGSVYTLSFDPTVDQVQVLLNTDTRQLNARVELLNGPNNIKQLCEIFTNNGKLNSLFVVFNTPGGGNTVRVTNIAPLEFPCRAYINAI